MNRLLVLIVLSCYAFTLHVGSQVTAQFSIVPLWSPPMGENSNHRVFYDPQLSRLIVFDSVARQGEEESNAVLLSLPSRPDWSWDVEVTNDLGNVIRYTYKVTGKSAPRYVSLVLPHAESPLGQLTVNADTVNAKRRTETAMRDDDAAAPFRGPAAIHHLDFSTASQAFLANSGIVVSDRMYLPGFITIQSSENALGPPLAKLSGADEKLLKEVTRAWEFFARRDTSRAVLGPRFDKDANWTEIAAHYYHAVDRLRRRGDLKTDSRFVAEALTYWSELLQKDGPVPYEGKPSTHFASLAQSELEKLIARGWELCVSLHQ